MSAAPGAMSNSSTRSATPQHEQHAELKKWIGYDFDPNIADTERLTQQLAALPKAGLAGPPPDALRGDSRDAYRKVTFGKPLQNHEITTAVPTALRQQP